MFRRTKKSSITPTQQKNPPNNNNDNGAGVIPQILSIEIPKQKYTHIDRALDIFDTGLRVITRAVAITKPPTNKSPNTLSNLLKHMKSMKTSLNEERAEVIKLLKIKEDKITGLNMIIGACVKKYKRDMKDMNKILDRVAELELDNKCLKLEIEYLEITKFSYFRLNKNEPIQ